MKYTFPWQPGEGEGSAENQEKYKKIKALYNTVQETQRRKYDQVPQTSEHLLLIAFYEHSLMGSW